MSNKIVLDWAMRKVSTTAKWSIGARLEYLCFADNFCLLSPTRTDIEAKLRRLARQIQLIIYTAKTKFVRSGIATPCAFTIHGEQINEVEGSQYLGSYIANDVGVTMDLENRIRKT